MSKRHAPKPGTNRSDLPRGLFDNPPPVAKVRWSDKPGLFGFTWGAIATIVLIVAALAALAPDTSGEEAKDNPWADCIEAIQDETHYMTYGEAESMCRIGQ